jgi:hypothetical protein
LARQRQRSPAASKRSGVAVQYSALVDLHFVFDVFRNIFWKIIELRSMNAFGLEVDLNVLEKLVEVPILLAQLINSFPVK